MIMDNRKKEFMENRRIRRGKSDRTSFKTEKEKQETREEVEQIKKNLINFASTSWGKQWIDSNLKIGRPFRMQRGIEYVKDERRIDNISISDGQIFATVQGTAPTPYRVKIILETIPEKAWKEIIEDLTSKSIHLIELLNGILSENIENIFMSHGYTLFPDAANGLNATCSCPDTAIPCKHIAAVILYLARILDFNPFLLFELHGKSKNEIFGELKFSKNDNDYEPSFSEKIPSSIGNIDFEFKIPKLSIKELNLEMSYKDEDFKIGFKYNKPGKISEILENIGIPQTIENKAFEIVLKSVYNTIRSKTYEMSLGID
jgi:uncharacterized Zn finger protein